jgi:amino acid transporter
MLRSTKGLRYFSLAAVIFFTVSGGPYGLEPLLYYGKDAALLLLIFTQVFWDIPTILMVLELNSLMPVNGGYYQWVKTALGLRWAFYEGWWTWLYTFVDLAIYPVLFVHYLAYFFPGVVMYTVPVCLVIIWVGAGLNILGIQPLGKISLLLGAIVVIPFLLLFIAGMHQHHAGFVFPHASLRGTNFSFFGLALYTVMWNFIGWDNATTYAGEVHRPGRSYIISTVIAFVLIFAIYFITVVTAQQSGINMLALNEKGFPLLGEWIGGRWLGAVIAVGGMASSLGIYLAVLLSVSRVPKVMADDKLLPAVLNKLHPQFNTPYISICIFSIVASLLSVFTFTDLLVVDVTLYGAGLTLEFISLIVLRLKAPLQPRSFKIPLKMPGLIILFLLPVSALLIALIASIISSGISNMPVLLTAGALLSAELVWSVMVLVRRRNKNNMRT